MQSRARKLIGLSVIVLVIGFPAGVRGQAIPGPCTTGILPSGALSLICVPAVGWNGQLVVYAHGYVAPGLPLGFYQLTTPDGTPIPPLVQALGYAFTTTSYRQNGLAILEGVEDIGQLVDAFNAGHPAPTRVHVAGVSEGGLVATLLAERSLDTFRSESPRARQSEASASSSTTWATSGCCSTTSIQASFPDRPSQSRPR